MREPFSRSRPAVYLAGPEVFLPDRVELGRRKREVCARHGFEGLFPLDAEIGRDGAEGLSRRIYRGCLAMMRAADLAVLNLTPFRGPSADVGTVLELGLLAGWGKPVFAYTNDGRDLVERVRASAAADYDAAAGEWRDAEGITIEDFGNADNLMLDMTLAEQGHPILRHQARPEERYRDLAGFEACLVQAAAALAGR
ncbi:MAG TPA: nucleoside 2-deoxyribosyltransferase [Stellaceae bacterium]|nr:nucleoside 2-deoxyribosyltransferase [Stellaceae bacterium]